MELKIILIMIIAFIIIVVLPAIGILIFLDKKDPKRRKAVFLSTPTTLYFLGHPFKPWYFVVAVLGISIVTWIFDLSYIISIALLIFILLTVRRTRRKKK